VHKPRLVLRQSIEATEIQIELQHPPHLVGHLLGLISVHFGIGGDLHPVARLSYADLRHAPGA
jgi:hypothetical protein